MISNINEKNDNNVCIRIKRKSALLISLGLSFSFLLTACSGNGKTYETGIDESNSSELTISETVSETTALDSAGTESVDNNSTETVTENSGIEYPYLLDDDKIAVNSVFCSEIENPDGDNTTVNGLVSVEVENVSDALLSHADLKITLEDGATVPIEINDLPAGEKIWAFATDNSNVDDSSAEIIVESITANNTDYSNDIADQFTEGLDVSLNGTEITVINNSGEDMNNVTIFCHAKLDDVLFGGIEYQYTAGSLSAGETTTIEADDCWTGEVEVVGAIADINN